MQNTPLAFVRNVLTRTPLRRFSQAFHRYEYMFTPAQLAFLVSCVDATANVDGVIVEIGCASGRTTIYLNRHLDETGDDRRYICIDTFSGFTDEDIENEVSQRAKPRTGLQGFRVNSKDWFDRNMDQNQIRRVTSYAADINVFDLASIAPKISLCLVDVDLYRPVKAALEKVHPRMARGGMVVVDDAKPNSLFDGAFAAYAEFADRIGAPRESVYEKLGIFRY